MWEGNINMWRITINVDTATKKESTEFLAKNGFTMSDAIHFFIDILASNQEMRERLIEMMEDAEDLKAVGKAERRLASGESETYTLYEVRKHLGL